LASRALAPQIFGLDRTRGKTQSQNWLRSDDHRVSHIVIAPEISVLTVSHRDVVSRAATVHQPSIRALGRMMSRAIVDDRVVEEGRPNQ
jgi:hypothetical protein